MINSRQFQCGIAALAATGALALSFSLVPPAQAVPAALAPAPVSPRVSPTCSEEWVDFGEGHSRRMKSQLCLNVNERGALVPTLTIQCHWSVFAGEGWTEPNGCGIADPAHLQITNSEYTDGGIYSNLSGVRGKGAVATTGRDQDCSEGSWKLWSSYIMETKDGIGRWNNNVEASHETTFNVTCS
ncbi:hypothetical protein [Streptomyces sp. NPDC059247]|uniref:hypothetical protein n=1 Tax=Streptomyces sp. NPDC059247 TaxID=3346790 RepID=UPI0036936F67